MARRSKARPEAKAYDHSATETVLRPEVGTQAQFKKKKPATGYRYDSSLSPALDWDEQNPARELGEWLIAQIEDASRLDPPHRFPEPRRFGQVEVLGLQDAASQLRALSEPFLNWSGKAERTSFDVPTLPLFVHERLSTKAILETLRGHERDRQRELQLFGDPQLPLHQHLEAYEHKGDWVNRLILGDSLVVMNSLHEYEALGGQVQMIYIDPPYGVKFGSNFQPFVRRREVKDNDDASMTREPEMVRAYRDTWELGLHSYLTYLRDRLLVARELLTPSGSIFVQIGDENVHHVRELADEIFGSENFVAEIAFAKTSSLSSPMARTLTVPVVTDLLLWYARDREQIKYRQLYRPKATGRSHGAVFRHVELPDGSRRPLTSEEAADPTLLPPGVRLYALGDLTSQLGVRYDVEFDGRVFSPRRRGWRTHEAGMNALIAERRVQAVRNSLRYVTFESDFPVIPLTNFWDDTGTGSFLAEKVYVVQTAVKAVERCVLMTTDPGDLVLDPTCGSGTTAFVAEQWGRRWIMVDTSRVPLALARQRLLTATFPYYELQDPGRGPSAGFVYKQRQNSKGEEIGGIVPHVTLRSIANQETPDTEVLVDRPEIDRSITRVSGPFCVEATIPTGVELEEGTDGHDADGSGATADDGFAERMLEALRRDPVLQLPENKTVAFKNVREPARSLALAAEAVSDPDDSPIAFAFGPENGAVTEKLVFEAAKEANARNYARLIVIGFAIEAGARALVEQAEGALGIPAVYVQATPDLVMGDLLKTMRSSQIFSVAGLPDVALRKVDPEETGGPQRYEVELLGIDVFDPTTMEADHRDAKDVPAWFLDTDWNEMCFHVSQAFFPRTSAWEGLKKALKGEYEESVWDHLSGVRSAPFTAGENSSIAVKVIDDRGNELLVVRSLDEAE